LGSRAKPNSSSAQIEFEFEDDDEEDKIPAGMKTLHLYLTR